MTEAERLHREKEWLEGEVRLAVGLSDRDRVRILGDLLETVEAIQRTKSPETLRREEEVRWILEREPGRKRYAELAERLE